MRLSLMRRSFDHVDLRVPSVAEARPFYEMLLPALGFTRDAKIEGWLQYEVAGTNGASEFVGVTESPQHKGLSAVSEDTTAQVRASWWTPSTAAKPGRFLPP